MTCKQLDPHEGFCRNCGRATAVVDGKVQHKRGRWREALGLPALTPRDAVSEIVREFRSPAIRCPDCNAIAQHVGGYYRCPWTTNERWGARRTEPIGTLIGCLRPYRDMEKRTA